MPAAMLDEEVSSNEITFEGPHPDQLNDELQSSIKDFDGLLASITSVDVNRKSLWKLIFENASTDRKNAYIAYVDLYMRCHSKPDMHAIHGLTLSKYLERMEKCNNQLLKLAELVAKADDASREEDDEETPIKSTDVFDQIQKRKNKK
jgi:hypothetical protein